MKETKSNKTGEKMQRKQRLHKMQKTASKRLIVCGLRDVRYDITSWNKNKEA